MRVLLAAAEKNVQVLLRPFLQDLGHEVESTSSGLGCVASLFDYQPDLLVLEQGILWGGFEGVIARMNDERDLCEIPVVLLAERGLRLSQTELPHVEALLPKPLCLRQLLRLGSILSGLVAASVPDFNASTSPMPSGLVEATAVNDSRKLLPSSDGVIEQWSRFDEPFANN